MGGRPPGPLRPLRPLEAAPHGANRPRRAWLRALRAGRARRSGALRLGPRRSHRAPGRREPTDDAPALRRPPLDARARPLAGRRDRALPAPAPRPRLLALSPSEIGRATGR